MNWIFVLIAFTANGQATVEKVYADTAGLCVSYGLGYLDRKELDDAKIQVAQCVGTKSGHVIPLAPIKIKEKTNASL